MCHLSMEMVVVGHSVLKQVPPLAATRLTQKFSHILMSNLIFGFSSTVYLMDEATM